MTDNELKQILASLVESKKETDDRLARVAESLAASEKKLAESLATSKKELAESLATSKKELAESLATSEKELAESLAASYKRTEKSLEELGKQIGGLGQKFGSFTEGLALASMEKILRERFGMEYITPRVRIRKSGDKMEIDVLAYANGENPAVYLVEVKSHLREDGVQQILKNLCRFPTFFPEHANKARYGILAAVDVEENARTHALQKGLFMASIQDDHFRLDVPEDFRPHRF